MSEKNYISTHNYNPGSTSIPAGMVFTEAQWEEFGGKPGSLAQHVKKGYITVDEQYVPELVQAPVIEKVVEKVEKDTKEEVVVEKAKAQGIWNYSEDELKDLDIGMLNTIYKDRAAEFDIKVNRPFSNKDNLIAKMTSEA
jgi:hypothetical protein